MEETEISIIESCKVCGFSKKLTKEELAKWSPRECPECLAEKVFEYMGWNKKIENL